MPYVKQTPFELSEAEQKAFKNHWLYKKKSNQKTYITFKFYRAEKIRYFENNEKFTLENFLLDLNEVLVAERHKAIGLDALKKKLNEYNGFELL